MLTIVTKMFLTGMNVESLSPVQTSVRLIETALFLLFVYTLLFLLLLDQLVNGLNALGVLPLVRDNPTLGRQLFVQGSPKELTAMVFYDMLPADLSPPMSNGRDKEEAQLMNWLNFLQFVEGIHMLYTP